METLKSLHGDRENMGIELYGIQQQLARQQMLAEQEQDKQTTLSLLRKQKYETLAQVRELYKNMQKQTEEERKQSKCVPGISMFSCPCYSTYFQQSSYVVMLKI